MSFSTLILGVTPWGYEQFRRSREENGSRVARLRGLGRGRTDLKLREEASSFQGLICSFYFIRSSLCRFMNGIGKCMLGEVP